MSVYKHTCVWRLYWAAKYPVSLGRPIVRDITPILKYYINILYIIKYLNISFKYKDFVKSFIFNLLLQYSLSVEISSRLRLRINLFWTFLQSSTFSHVLVSVDLQYTISNFSRSSFDLQFWSKITYILKTEPQFTKYECNHKYYLTNKSPKHLD